MVKIKKYMVRITVWLAILIPLLVFIVFSEENSSDNDGVIHPIEIENKIIDNSDISGCGHAYPGYMVPTKSFEKDGFFIEFFIPCTEVIDNYHCKVNEHCGIPAYNGYDCKENHDCDTIVSIKNSANKVVMQGVGGYQGGVSPIKYQFGDLVELAKAPDGFPYLMLRHTSFGSWGSGYYYHLYSTEEKLEKIATVGPSWKGFYKDSKGNYIIGIQQDYWPEMGSNADHLTDEILYRLSSEEKYALTKKRFVIDIDANKAKIIQFSNGEINRLMAYAKKSNEKVMDYFSSKSDESYFWTPGIDSKRWPLRLLRIRESDPRKGYVYADLFDFIRNGRIDLAKQYFDILIPEQYNQFKHILPEILNSKDKLWIGYLKDLKEQGEYRRHDSDPLYFPDESTKDLYWPVFELLNDKYGIL